MAAVVAAVAARWRIEYQGAGEHTRRVLLGSDGLELAELRWASDGEAAAMAAAPEMLAALTGLLAAQAAYNQAAAAYDTVHDEESDDEDAALDALDDASLTLANAREDARAAVALAQGVAK